MKTLLEASQAMLKIIGDPIAAQLLAEQWAPSGPDEINRIVDEAVAAIKSDVSAKLLALVTGYIKETNIGCADGIYQSDRVILGACEFIEKCCELVGYAKEQIPAQSNDEIHRRRSITGDHRF